MHVEALTYSRQTLGFSPPSGLGTRAARTRDAAGRCRGAGRTLAPRLDRRRRLRLRQREMGARNRARTVPHRPGAGHERRSSPPSSRRAATASGHSGAMPAGTWRQRRNAERPIYWQEKRDGVWSARRYREVEQLPPHAPVCFVSWFEADAWCRWAGRRLPSEAEWEAAAIGLPDGDGSRLADRRRRWPWGDAPPTPATANLDFAHDGPVDVAGCPAGDSAFGCRQMIGNVWEWTASDFLPFERIRGRSLRGLLATVVRHPQGAARRLLGDERPHCPAGLSQLLHARPQ